MNDNLPNPKLRAQSFGVAIGLRFGSRGGRVKAGQVSPRTRQNVVRN